MYCSPPVNRNGTEIVGIACLWYDGHRGRTRHRQQTTEGGSHERYYQKPRKTPSKALLPSGRYIPLKAWWGMFRIWWGIITEKEVVVDFS